MCKGPLIDKRPKEYLSNWIKFVGVIIGLNRSLLKKRVLVFDNTVRTIQTSHLGIVEYALIKYSVVENRCTWSTLSGPEAWTNEL
jgi:hypothetical protein